MQKAGCLEDCSGFYIQGVSKIVQASTSSLYGAHNPRPFKEDADISKPLSPYAASKGAAEMLSHSYHHLHGLEITVLRYFTVYGPAGRPDMSIFRFIQWIAEENPMVMACKSVISPLWKISREAPLLHLIVPDLK
jgi:nucleoside-diphosphate-sugar epimerase